MRSWAADGMDAVAVQEATELAADTARAGAGPCFLELRTYRFRAHSMYDADRYRDRTELEAWRARDPVELAAAALAADGLLDDAGRKELEEAVGREIDDAVRAAGAAPLEPVEDLTRFVTTATEDGS